MENEITCPSGLRGRIRNIKLKEFKALGDRRALANGTALDGILKACWLETLDAGPAYAKGVSWGSNALEGDRFYALMMIRAVTYGSKFCFDPTCPGCKKKIQWEIDLADLPVRSYPADVLEKHARGERFSAVIAGKKVEFTLLTTEDQKRLAKILDEDSDPVVAALAYRTRSIEGLERDEFRAWIDDLDMQDADEFTAAVDAVSGGVETSFGVECNRCGEFTVELPFGGQAFWKPKKAGETATT